MAVNFVGEQLAHRGERAEIERLVLKQAGANPSATSGTIHWPESDNASACPTLVLRWHRVPLAHDNGGQGELRCTVTDFEAELEDFEERRRARIAEANEY